MKSMHTLCTLPGLIELEEKELGEQLSRGGPDPSLTEDGLPHAALSFGTTEHSSHGVRSREPCDEDHQSTDHR
jgi:hypothetical protein